MSSKQAANSQSGNRNLILWIVGGVVGLALIVLLAWSIAGDEAIPDEVGLGEVTVTGDPLPFLPEGVDSDPALGFQAPSMSGTDWNDNEISIEADGRPKIVMFLAHWCGFCQAEVPEVQAFIDQGGLPSDVDLYGVTIFTDRLRGNWPPQDWLEDEGWTAPTIMDDAQSSSVLAYGVRGTPFYVVLDGENRNLGRFSGAIGIGGFQQMINLAQASIGG